MNKTLQTILIVVGSLLIAALLMGAGWFIGQQGFIRTRYPGGMMGSRFSFSSPRQWDALPNANGGTPWQSPMGARNPGAAGRNPGFFQEGLRSDFRMGPGMMGRGFTGNQLFGTPPNMEEAQAAFQGYLDALGYDDLAIHEIMIFDNNAYAIIIEESTGIGAMELLLDPASMQVYPEYGPNHMWNLKYGMMGARGTSGRGIACPMGGVSDAQVDIPASMAVTAEQASGYAQEYLDSTIPGAAIDGEGMAFYGYYTFDYQLDGEVAGMLSVNGQSGQVWLHTWHGTMIEEMDFD